MTDPPKSCADGGWMRALYDNIRKVAEGPIVSSEGRGKFRSELRLRPGRLSALLRGHKIEEVLQRTLVAVAADRCGDSWFNEFNMAGGLGGGNAHNRHAVDLGRGKARFGTDKLRLDLFELKDWDGTDTPESAARQLLGYGLLYWSLALRRVAPYQRTLERVEAVRLAVMAPASYFSRHGLRPDDRCARPLFSKLADELERLKREHPGLRPLSLFPRPVILDAALSKQDFLDCFHRARVERMISLGGTAASPLEVLVTDRIPLLGEWLDQALGVSGL